MNRDIGWIAGPLAALALFAFIVWQTLGALSASGAWARGGRAPIIAPTAPFAFLDALVAAPRPPLGATMRDPFGVAVAAPVSPAPGAGTVRKPVVPAAPARPVLTAIVWDADPRAIVRWQGHDYSVRSGGLFDDFQVVSITRDQVVLKRGDESIVLQRKPQGE